MFDTPIQLEHPALLVAACILAGLAIGLIVYATALTMGIRAQPVAMVIGDAHLRIRRERAKQDSTLFGLVMSLMPVLVPVARRLPLESIRRSLSGRYARAGWPGGLSDDEILGIALLLSVVCTIPAILIVAVFKPVAAPLGLLALLLGPGLVSMSLSSRGDQRELAISRTMPFVLDLLVLTIRAGASLNIALERVVIDYADHPIGIEFRATLTDLELGATLTQAFQNLLKRAPVPVVRTFVDDVIQSEELGRPIADTLERLADRVRVRRVQEAVDTAGKAKVMVLVPGMLVLMATLLVLFAPFIVRWYYGGYTGG